MRLPALLLTALALLVAAPAARSADIVGVADQSSLMFYSPHFQALHTKVSRLIVSYDAVLTRTFEVADIDAWMYAARASRIEPLVSFNHSRGCYDGKGVVKRKACRLPSVARYRKAFDAFRKRYPDVAVYSPWNEINHRSQPTAFRPDRAADFYNVVRKRCRGCKVVAADVLDQRGLTKYLKAFKRRAKGNPRLWGLHNYQDTNNGTTKGTKEMLRAVKGTIWLTETGGIVAFGRHRPFSPSRAAEATRFMFRLASSSRRIQRLYIYNWFGTPRTARFDAGLTSFKGTPRPAYEVVRRHLKQPGANPGPSPEPPPPPPGGGPGPSPTPTPTPSPTPSPTPTPTPTPTPCPLLICP